MKSKHKRKRLEQRQLWWSQQSENFKRANKRPGSIKKS